MRFFSRASVVRPVQTVFRFAPRRVSAAVSIVGAEAVLTRGDLALDFGDAGELPGSSAPRVRQPPAGWLDRRRHTGPESAVSGKACCFKVAAESLARLILSGWLPARRQPLTRRLAPGPTTPRSASSIASSTRRPPNAMQRGSPLSIQPRVQL